MILDNIKNLSLGFGVLAVGYYYPILGFGLACAFVGIQKLHHRWFLANKQTLTIEVPRNETVEKFLWRKDGYQSSAIAKKIVNFIEGKIDWDREAKPFSSFYNALLAGPYDTTSFVIQELVNNSYDSFAKGYSNHDRPLILKTVLHKTPQSIRIKFKDNGEGFVGKEKGVRFKYWDFISHETREKVASKSIGMFGGHGMGLRISVLKIENANGEFLVKNRKKNGCAITISTSIPKK